MVLVGNKIDLKNDRDVTTKEGEDLAVQLKVYTYRCCNYHYNCCVFLKIVCKKI